MAALQKTIMFVLLKVFDIRHGEGKRAALMQLLIFLIISTLLIIKPTANALFINRFGVESLPFAFILVAIIAGVTASFYARWLTKLSLYRILTGTLGLSVIALVMMGVLFHFRLQTDVVIYIFYIGVAIFAVLTASQFWILANMVFDVREAKRLFGFIGAGAIAGGIFGGYLTSFLAKNLNSENLVYVAAILLTMGIPIVDYIWNNYVKKIDTASFSNPEKKENPPPPLILILKSKHLTYMAAIIAIGVVVAKLVDYQFSAIAAEKINDQDELTAFFGFWFSTFNVLALLIQLLFTRQIVGKYGVGISLLFLPIAILFGAITLLIVPALWAAIAIKMADGSLKQSIHKAAIELLAMPIPNEIKKQTKTYIDVAIDSVATGVGGLILIFLVRGLNLSTAAISVMIILLIAVWIYFAQKVREEYFLSFKLKTKNARKRGLNQISNFSKEGWENALLYLLENGSDRQLLIALRRLRRKKQVSTAFLRKLSEHKSPTIQQEIEQTLAIRQQKELLTPEIKALLESPENIKIGEFPLAFLLQLPPVLFQIESQKAVDILYDLIEQTNFKVYDSALKHLGRLHRKSPKLTYPQEPILRLIFKEVLEFRHTLSLLFSQKNQPADLTTEVQIEQVKINQLVLISLLEQRLDTNLDRIFRLLSLKYIPEDMLSIHRGIRSKNTELQSTAVEFLDNLLDVNLKRTIIPLVETALLENYPLETITNLNLNIPNEIDALKLLMKIKDNKIKPVVINLIKALNLGDIKPINPSNLTVAYKKGKTANE